jgi:hypothetical protein
MAFDITVPLPLCPSNAAAVAADHVAWLESVASLKRRKYLDALRAKGVAFRPLVVDVFGSAHREFQDTIHHIARLCETIFFSSWAWLNHRLVRNGSQHTALPSDHVAECAWLGA